MTTSARLPLAAGGAVLLASIALEPVFVNLRWVTPVLLVLACTTAVSVLARRAVTLAPWAPVLEMLGALVVLTVLYAPANAWLGVVPTPGSLGDMRTLLGEAGYAVRTQVSPAQALDELIFLAAIGVAVVAVAVDILAVSMRRPAVGGLALLVLYSIPTAALVDGIPWWPFVGGAAGFLLLLVADGRERLSRWGRRADDDEDSPSLGMLGSQRIGLLAVVCGVALPLLVPALPPGLLQTAGNGVGDGPGTSLNPLARLAGDLTLPEPLDLLRVRTNVDDPYYLRMVSLETYTDQGWAPGNLDDTIDANVDELPGPPSGAATRQVEAEIEILDQNDVFLPTYYATRDIDTAGDWRFDEISDTIFSENDRTAGLTYVMDAEEPVPDAADLAAADDLDSEDQVQRRFTALPLLVRPEVAALVTDLTQGADGPYERTMAIMDFFTDPGNSFFYSLATEPGTSGDDLVDFLTNRRGYCEQYAAAMGVLLRFANVPARVVIGYTQGSQNAGEWTITTDDAHAWVEVYFDGVGWVPFDPTPLSNGRGVERAYAPRLDSEGSGGTPTTSNPNAPTDRAAPSGNREEQLPFVPGGPGTNSSAGLLDPVTALAGAAAVLVVGLLLMPGVIRLLRRRSRLRAARGDGIQAAHAAWDELTATSLDLGGTPRRAETPRSVALRLAREHGVDKAGGEAVRLLAVAEERARYAPAEQARVDGDLAAALRTVSRALRRDSRGRDRLRAALLPPSTLRDLGAAAQRRRAGLRERWLALRAPAAATE